MQFQDDKQQALLHSRSYYIPIEPVAKGRPRLGRGGRVFTPKKTLDAEHAIQTYLRLDKPYMVTEGPIRVSIKFMFVRPKSAKNRVHVTVKPDLDNLVKIIDAANGILWTDDAQITELSASKVYAEKAGILLVVELVA